MSDEHLEWYYVSTSHASTGPVQKAEIKPAFQSGNVNGDCLCWNETMANWTLIKDVPGLVDYLTPAPAPAPAAAPKPAGGFRPPVNVMGGGGGGDLAAAIAARKQKNADLEAAAAAAAAAAATTPAAAPAATPSYTPAPAAAPVTAPRPVFTPKPAAATPEPSSPSPSSKPNPILAASPRADPLQPKVTTAIPAPPAQKEKGSWVELKTPEGLFYYYDKDSKKTQWDKPDCLKSADEFDKDGDWVWMPHTQWGFVPAKRSTSSFSDGKHHLETEDGQQHVLAAKIVLDDLNWGSLRRPVQDLVMLDTMNMPLILHALKTRFQKNDIYTNVGNILISLNPYKRLPLYTPTVIDTYRRRGNKTMPPHVYLIADQAYTGMLETGVPQSIVISGESGAGKTECTKQALQYLTDVAGSSTSNVEQKILASNPILEAFGNAKTVRNNNSSRFGKCVEVNFDNYMQISGSTNTNYLLEKIRVVTQSPGERNYHSFYQLCRGATPEQRRQLHLDDVNKFFYLNQSGCDTVDDMDDVEEHNAVLSAMRELGWSETEISDVYRVVAGVLHLGNVRFESSGDRQCVVTDTTAVQRCTELLQIDQAGFHKAVTTRVMRVTGQADIDVSLGKEEAEAARDALAKFIYEKLFDWIVQRINRAIGRGNVKTGPRGNSTISILDIFGFEIFEHNQFEQLCINYTNEKLQQFFNQHTFKKEEELYTSEGINFTHIEYIDNQPVLDLIEQRPTGILPMVDEEIRMPRGSDKTFIAKLVQQQAKHPHFKTYLKDKDMFIVEHYAGTVLYDSHNFLEKNRDALNADAHSVLMQSSMPFLTQLINETSDAYGGKKATLGSKFSKQLSDLMAALNATEPHYIRCIKPNPNKAQLEFHPRMVLEQLTYSGVFEAVKIRKSGFPFRYSHLDFYQRFRCVLPQAIRYDYGVKQNNVVAGCNRLIEVLNQRDLVQIGRTRVLYRAAQHLDMELVRNVAVEALVVKMQAAYRGWYCRKLKKRLLLLKPVCVTALKSRDIAVVEAALEKCQGCGYDFFEYTELQKHHFRLVEEKRIEKELLAIIDGGNVEARYEELCKVLACSDDIGADNPVIVRCRKVVREIEEKRRAVSWLRLGVENVDEEQLRWALDKVAEYKIVDGGTAEAQRTWDKIQAEKPVVADLEAQTAVGGFLKEGDAIAVPALKAAVDKARAFGVITAAGLEVMHKASVLLAVRESLVSAQGTKDKALWNCVAEACGQAGGELAQHAEIQAACDEVAHQAAVDEVAEKLDLAVRGREEEQITFGLDQCVRLRVDRAQYPVVAQAEEVLAQIIEANRLIAAALASVDEEELVFAVQYAEGFAYDKPHVTRARELRDTVLQLQSDIDYALEMLEEEPMRDVAARADAIQYNHETVTRVKTWLFNTSEDKFTQEQLKVAVRLGDEPRRVRCTIKLKELVFAKMGAMFELDKYIRLRTPHDWAERKLLTLNREKLAASCRNHTRDLIHTSLTEHEENPLRGDTARKIFKNVCGIMGDRNYGSPATLTQDLLTQCLADPWLRDEVYCQLIKQLTNNPSPDSTRKGWTLLATCLETFPPQPEFENYLGWWLKHRAPDVTRFTTLYQLAVFSGPLSAPPTEMQLQRVANGEILRQVNFQQVRPYTPPAAAIPPPGQAQQYYQQRLRDGQAKQQQEQQKQQQQAQALRDMGGSQALTAFQQKNPGVQIEDTPALTPTANAAAIEAEVPIMPPPPRPAAKAPLPDGWDVAHAEDGSEYYYNISTGASSWTRPTA